MFVTFYQDALREALRSFQFISCQIATHFLERVEHQFHRKASNIDGRTAAITISRSTHESVGAFWQQRISQITCFLCLKNEPEHVFLGCGHSICSNFCTIIFGQRAPFLTSWIFRFSTCPLCNTVLNRAITISLKPPTAGYRILCIDGGGVRGVVPLQILIELQKSMNLPIPVQEHFDLSFGTSTGTYSSRFGNS